MTKRVCIFCNSDLANNKAKEHVFPVWLLKYLKIESELVAPTHLSKAGEPVSTRIHDLSSFVAGNVCANCNNGWMSKLETSSKQLLVDLIDARKETIELTSQERFTIARWATKTALILNLASNYHKNIPPEHYRYLKQHSTSLPTGLIVVAQQHHGDKKFYWLQSASWEISTHADDVKHWQAKVTDSSYKIALLLGKLIILVAYNPHKELVFGLWKGIHIPFWPQSGQVGWYDKKVFPWNDSAKSIMAFHLGVKLIDKSIW